MTITIVTPWLEHPELLSTYEAAMTALGPGDRVLVINNGGAPHLETYRWSHYINVHENLGFSRACNVGLSLADTEAVCFLNNDIRAVKSTWHREIKDELRPGVLVGPMGPSQVRIDGTRFPYIDGWCLAGMREDLLRLGGWDEGYEEPSYFGDNDLCLRAVRAGMKLVYLADDFGLKHISNYTSRSMDVSGVSSRNRARFEERARDLLAVAA